MFEPSEILISTLAEVEGHKSVIGSRIEKIKKDFLDTIDELPDRKRQLADMPPSFQQAQIDLLFTFFVAGACAVLDKSSHFNVDRTELENRKDLN
jgi:hypothetical protein